MLKQPKYLTDNELLEEIVVLQSEANSAIETTRKADLRTVSVVTRLRDLERERDARISATMPPPARVVRVDRPAMVDLRSQELIRREREEDGNQGDQ
jgi:hypothetical protein